MPKVRMRNWLTSKRGVEVDEDWGGGTRIVKVNRRRKPRSIPLDGSGSTKRGREYARKCHTILTHPSLIKGRTIFTTSYANEIERYMLTC
jgi:hypothetical protein